MFPKRPVFILLVALLFSIIACQDSSSSETNTSNNNVNSSTTAVPTPTPIPPGAPVFRIVSGSENQTLENIILAYASREGIVIQIDYLGSVDIKLLLEQDDTTYDAVWPANDLWITVGDKSDRVKHIESIMRSPVVFAVKKSVAQRLGWVGRNDVTVSEILDAAENEDLRLMITSATQSNSGASAYFGFLYAFAGKTDTLLTTEDLNNPEVQEKIKRVLGTFDRSSSSSGFLKELFLNNYDQFDGLVNYEALIIEANQALTAAEKEPLYVIYPVDGLAMANSPLGYVDQGDSQKEEIFLGLQEYLLSDEVQNQLMAAGRRIGVGNLMDNPDPTIFNPDWGIDPNRIIIPIRFPNADVIEEALTLYQTAFRKPSYTIYILDYSGSMSGEVATSSEGSITGETQLEQAMQILLDQTIASQYLIQASPDDVTIVIPFNNGTIPGWQPDLWTVRGNNPQDINALLERIRAIAPGGGTNFYEPTNRALNLLLNEPNLRNYFPAIILMTDGKVDPTPPQYGDVQTLYQNNGLEIPIFSIMFGQASKDDLQPLADLSAARVYDGRVNLIDAFRNAKGNN